MDNIVIKKSANQDGVTALQPLDPKKLIIRPNVKNVAKVNPRFCIHNRNLQRITSFKIDPNYRYCLDNSNIKFDKSSDYTQHIVTPDILYQCLVDKVVSTTYGYDQGRFYIHIKCNAEAQGIIYTEAICIYENTKPQAFFAKNKQKIYK